MIQHSNPHPSLSLPSTLSPFIFFYYGNTYPSIAIGVLLIILSFQVRSRIIGKSSDLVTLISLSLIILYFLVPTVIPSISKCF